MPMRLVYESEPITDLSSVNILIRTEILTRPFCKLCIPSKQHTCLNPLSAASIPSLKAKRPVLHTNEMRVCQKA